MRLSEDWNWSGVCLEILTRIPLIFSAGSRSILKSHSGVKTGLTLIIPTSRSHGFITVLQINFALRIELMYEVILSPSVSFIEAA